MTAMAPPQMISLSRLRMDGETQSRCEIDQKTVLEYAEAMKAGVEFPSITVFFDGTDLWPADGFHRIAAAKLALIGKISANVLNGPRRDALLYSVGANTSHGLRRSNADKRRVVEIVLADSEWVKWSDREIARHCAVSADLVGAVRKEVYLSESTDNTVNITRKVVRGNTEYEMKVPLKPGPETKPAVKNVTTIPHTDVCFRCKRFSEDECEHCDPIHVGFSVQYCRNIECPYLKKREMNDNVECEIEGKLPGNMAECPLVLEKIELKRIEVETEEDAKFPVTAKCKALKCKDLRFISPGLHVCSIKGMRPENMCGRYPDGCPQVQEEIPDAPEEVTTENEENEPFVPIEYPSEYLLKQIDRCRKRQCSELIDDEDRTACRVMEKMKEDGNPWCRYDCPIRPNVPEPKPYTSSRVQGSAFTPADKAVKTAVMHRQPSSPNQDNGGFKVNAGRYELATIRQMVTYGDADDEQEAVDLIFRDGAALWLDKIERRVQEGEES
jgi:hypothetical protein